MVVATATRVVASWSTGMELSFKGATVLTKRLATLRKNQLLKRFHQPVNELIGGAMALVLWTADFLAVTGVMSQIQQDLIFNSELGNDIFKFGKLVETACDENLDMPVGHIGIFNRSFAMVARPEAAEVNNYLNLHTGDLVGYDIAMHNLPIEIIYYNLSSLFTTRLVAYNRLRRMKKPEVPDAANEYQSY